MADEQNPKVTAAYRALGAEEPPRALDEAILAASRRPPKAWTQRWAVPLSLAAVLVLSITVTLRIQQEAPELQSMAPPPAPPIPQQEKGQVASLNLKADTQLRAAKSAAATRESRDEPKAFNELGRDQAPDVAVPAPAAQSTDPSDGLGNVAGMIAGRSKAERDSIRPESSIAGPAARQAEERVSRDAEAAARAPQAGAALAKRSMADAGSAAAPPPAPAARPAPVQERPAQVARLEAPPERELERIATLRLEGKHEEADKALAEFRRRFPDYRMSDAMRERVERVERR